MEREHELALISGALDAARAGRGAGLLLVGEAGIGKTALLQAATRAAAALTTLSARGAPLERDYGFGIVRQLFGAVLQDRQRRRDLLDGPAALAATALGLPGSAPEPGQDPTFAAFHGLFWLLNDLAEREPVVVLVDDAHWADLVSLRFLAYLARRLEGLPLALVLSWRDPEPGAPRDILDDLRALDTVREVPLGALTLAGALTLSGGAANTESLHRASGGNPFYLGEMLRADASGELLVASTPEAVRDHVAARLRRLGRTAEELAEAVAVLGPDAELHHAAIVAGITTAEAQLAADTLVEAGLLTGARPLRFAHPVLRTAVEGGLRTGERAALHRRAADVLAAEQPDRAATHLLATDPAGDEVVVARLLAAAQRAVEAGAPESGIQLANRALAEPPHEPFPTLLLLGRAHREAGDTDSEAAYRRAAEAASTTEERVAALRGLAGSQMAFNRIPDATGTLDRAIAELRDADPELTHDLEADLLLSGLYENELVQELGNRVERVVGGLTDGSRAARRLWICAAMARINSGVGTAEEALGLVLRGMPEPDLVGEHPADVPGPEAALTVISLTDRHDLLWPVIEALEEHSRATGALLHIVCGAGWRSYAHFLAGELAAGEAAGWEALALAPQVRFPTITAVASAPLLFNLVAQGKLDEADEMIRTIDVDGPPPPKTLQGLWLDWARGELGLARNDLAEVERLVDGILEEIGRRGGAPVGAGVLPHLLAVTGRPDLGRPLSRLNVEQCRRWGSARLLSQALVVEAEFAPDRAGELLAEACAVLEGTPFRLDLARALVAHGAHLRRRRERVAARPPLTRGLDLATRCGAQPLVEQATAELLACGARPRRQVLTGVESLTPSELRIATLAAHGRTNAQIAQTLFVTRSTVETHLSAVYRKLNVRSRAELPELLRQ